MPELPDTEKHGLYPSFGLSEYDATFLTETARAG